METAEQPLRLRPAFHPGALHTHKRALARRRARPVRTPCQEIVDRIHLNPNRLRETRTTMIYFIRCGSSVKIGRSDNPEARMRQMQAGCPEPLELLGRCRGFACDETVLHHAFAADRHAGEWFRISPLLEETIGRLCRG